MCLYTCPNRPCRVPHLVSRGAAAHPVSLRLPLLEVAGGCCLLLTAAGGLRLHPATAAPPAAFGVGPVLRNLKARPRHLRGINRRAGLTVLGTPIGERGSGGPLRCACPLKNGKGV